MKNLTRSLISAALLLALAGCTDMGTAGSASRSTNSAASASASAQVKALCDSSVAKSKAGDVAGAKADINQAIANVARVKLASFSDETCLENMQKRYAQGNPAEQKMADTIVDAMGKIQSGDPEGARILLGGLYLGDNYNVWPFFAAVEEYTIIGDFTKARALLTEREKRQAEFFSADYRMLMGDVSEARSDSAKALNMVQSSNKDALNLESCYEILAQSNAVIGDFDAAYANLRRAQILIDEAQLSDDVRGTTAFIKKLQSNPTLCWSNPANPRRVAMGQVSKARCELALAQAKAGDIGAAKATLYFIIDEPDKIATEKAIAQAGANFLQSGDVAKGIETLVVIPPAKQATAAQIRETTKTWVDIKSDRLPDIAAKLTEAEKRDLLKKLELAILDCATQADVAKTLSIAAAQNGQGDPSALVELSNNYLNLQNVLKAVYKSLSEE